MAGALSALILLTGAIIMPSFCYSREDLLHLKTNATKSVAKDVYFTLKELFISSVQPTKRGHRAFSKQQFQIPSVVTNRQNVTNNCSIPIRGIGNTLRSLPTHHVQQPSIINVHLDATSSARKIKSNSELMRIGHWNSRSMKTKVVHVCDLIVQNQLDVLVITESWLTGDNKDNLVIGDINTTLPNYRMFHLGTGVKFGRSFGLTTCGRPQLKLLLLLLSFYGLGLRPISGAGRRKLQPNLAPTPYHVPPAEEDSVL